MSNSIPLAIPVRALGLMVLDIAGDAATRAYGVLEDRTVYLLPILSGRESNLTPVPAELQGPIRDAHPELDLTFPMSARNAGGRPRGGPVRLGDRSAQLGPTAVSSVATSIEDAGRRSTVSIALHDPVLALPAKAGHGGRVTSRPDWDLGAVPLEQLPLFGALTARLLRRQAWKTTAWHARALTDVRSGEAPLPAVTSESALHARLRDWERIHDELVRDPAGEGAKAILGLVEADSELGFDRAGRPVLTRGHGEFIVARLAGLRALEIPVTARHADWEATKENIRAYARRRKGRVYQQIDHPDLADFPFHHGADRIPMLREGLSGYSAQGELLLDIGAHWGYMSQQMERLGFNVTAVESNNQCARFARLLAHASGSRYEVWKGRVFDFPAAERQKVVLALNIFHHLIKTEDLHDRLIAFLKRLQAVEIILFEPHVPDPPAQMEGAFRNYGEEEFASFVAKHAGLSTIEPLGRAQDGRPLFKLAR